MTAPAPILTDLPARLAALRGWRRPLLLVLLGAVLAGALPPFYVLPAAVLAFTGLAWVLDGASRRRALADGWLFGFGHGLAGLGWIANALLVDAGRTGWMFPFALLAIGVGFGVFQALVAFGAVWARPGAARILALGLCWLAVEWLKSWVLTGFPWNTVGTAFALSDALIQPAALGGPWLLSCLVLIMGLAPALGQTHGIVLPRRLAGWTLLSVLLVAAVWTAGTLRLSSHAENNTLETVVRLVQPAIEQADKWQSGLYESHFATQIALSLLQPAREEPDVIIWPEAAVPHTFLRREETRAQLAAAAPESGHLLTGAVSADHDADGNVRPYNSLLVIDRDGLVDSYDKSHLVPFGEYVPLRGVLPIDKLTPGGVDFAPGPGPRVLSLRNLPSFGPLICYEVIFPAEILGPEGRPAWLVNVTNDAWYGHSTGPYQHFQAARMRAVEQGLPMVRVANTGISGVIDPLGRVVASLPLGHRGILDVALPARLDTPTIYGRIGDWSLFLALCPFAAGLAWALPRQQRAGDVATSSATGRC